MIKVKFFTLLRLMLGIKEVDVSIDGEVITVGDLLKTVEKQIGKPFIGKMLSDSGDMLRGTIILINGKNILHIDKLDSVVHDGETVSFFPPGGGG